MASPQYEFSYDYQDQIYMKILSHIVCIDTVSSQYKFSYAYGYSLYLNKLPHIGLMYMSFPQYEFSCAHGDSLLMGKYLLIAGVLLWLFSSMSSHVTDKITFM